MRNVILIAVAAAFAAVSIGAPAMAAGKPKNAAGMCGEFKYFDTKTKTCKDKRG